ncbi:hypothetical protein ACKKBF_B12595 [Auxenochlorella protothecoides x Auxenochlorella symbiontica]
MQASQVPDAPLPLQQGEEVALQGGASSSDSVVIHPFLHSPLPMLPEPLDFGIELDAFIVPSRKKAGRRGLRLLTQARQDLGAELASSAALGSSMRVDVVQARYLGLLLALIGQQDAEKGGGLDPGSPFRSAARYVWRGGPRPHWASSDAILEVVAALMARSTALMRAAAAACVDAASGVRTPAAMQAYKYLLAAAGQLETAKDRLLPHLPPEDPSVAAEAAAVSALSQHCLAEAQYLTTLRAIAKGTSPTLIASLAAEAASLYAASSEALAQAGAVAPKLGRYAEYRAGTLRALSLTFMALVQWRSPGGAGGARATAAEALRVWAAAKAAATAYDAAEPRTLNLDHRRSDEVVQGILEDTARRVSKNGVDGSPGTPSAAPAMPGGQRLVAAAPYSLPPPDVTFASDVAGWTAGSAGVGAKQDGNAASTAPAGTSTCRAGAPAAQPPPPLIDTSPRPDASPSCGRWLLFCIAAPLFALVSLVGMLVWLLLLPFKLLCLPCGCAAQLAASVVEGLVKLPLRGMLWASGKPYASGQGPKGAVVYGR